MQIKKDKYGASIYAKDYVILELLKNLKQHKPKTFIEIPADATVDQRISILNVLGIPGVIVHQSGNILTLSLEVEDDS